MLKGEHEKLDREFLVKKLKDDEKGISHMLEELESMDKMVSVIYREKNEERAIFCLLLLLTTKLDLGYVESYYFSYDSTEKSLTYKEGYFDLRRITDSKLERIYTLAQERMDIERVGFLNEVLTTNQPRYSIKKGEFHTPYEFLNRLQNYTVIPICYGKKKYGIIILAGNRKFIRFERKEKEIIDLFKYNLSMYLYNRKLEINEMENERLKTIGHFANSIVHEFKTPISVIKGLASLAKNKLHDPAKVGEYLDNIIKEANRIVDMSQEVSEYAGLKERVLEKTTFNVMEILRQEVEKFRSNLELLQIQVIFVGDESWSKEGNRERFGRLIGYILKNAIENVDYSKENKYILIKLEDSGGKLTIEDNGCGIKERNVEKVFDPFFTTKINGTGLGLTIVKEALKKNGGSVTAESAEGQYTRIIIEA